MPIILSATNHSLQASLTESPTTQPTFIVNYADHNTSTDAFVEGSNQGTLADATADQEILAAPASNVSRTVSDITIYNGDTASITVSVYKDVGGTNYMLCPPTTLYPGQILAWNGTSWSGANIPSSSYNPDANLLINGNFMVAQRGTSFTSATTPANSDDTYLLDQWTLLSDGNDIVDVTQDTTNCDAYDYSCIGLDVESANKKFGIIQLIEAKHCYGAVGKTVSLSFKAKVSNAGLDNVKAMVLSWNGTADSLTSDVVNAWGADATAPTLVASWTAENTPANLNVTTSWATYKIENISIDTANAKNIAVFIWCDRTSTTVGHFLYITNVKLNIGASATEYNKRLYADELSLCQRYYEIGTCDGAWGGSGSGELFGPRVCFSVPKRVTPTPVVGASYNGAASGTISNTYYVASTQGFTPSKTGAVSPGQAGVLYGSSWTASAEL